MEETQKKGNNKTNITKACEDRREREREQKTCHQICMI
jgi:hypothetical protein